MRIIDNKKVEQLLLLTLLQPVAQRSRVGPTEISSTQALGQVRRRSFHGTGPSGWAPRGSSEGVVFSSHHSHAKLCLRGLPERLGLSLIHVAHAKPFAKLGLQT